MTMLAERKRQLRDSEDYPSRLGMAAIKNHLTELSSKSTVSSFTQEQVMSQGITTKALLVTWAEKHIANLAYADVIQHLRGVGQVTHTMAKLDASVTPSENFSVYSKLDHYMLKNEMPALVRTCDDEVIEELANRNAIEVEDTPVDTYSKELEENPFCLIGGA